MKFQINQRMALFIAFESWYLGLTEQLRKERVWGAVLLWSACFLLVTLLCTCLLVVFPSPSFDSFIILVKQGSSFLPSNYTQAHCARLVHKSYIFTPENITCLPSDDSLGKEGGVGLCDAGRQPRSWLDRGCLCLSSWSVDLPVAYFLRVAYFQSKINGRKCLSELAHHINLLWIVFYGVLLLNRMLLEINCAGVQPRQDPGEPSGWTASARERHVGLALIGPSLLGRERERKKETRPGICSKVWQLLYFLP